MIEYFSYAGVLIIWLISVWHRQRYRQIRLRWTNWLLESLVVLALCEAVRLLWHAR